MNMQNSGGVPTVQEFSIRVPKNGRKKYNMMRFNSVLNVDFGKWTQVKMERENNLREFKGIEEEQPKFGAGSEFGREAKEEARRKKYGIIAKRYKPEDQPWILKVGGKTGKKFKGIREGGITDNAGYYVFTHASDGAIEAYPLCEWYNFQPIARYKALSAEEAEQEFSRRNKAMNYFSLMLRKRLRNCEDGEMEEEEVVKAKKKTSKSNDLKISDMDEWVDSEEEESAEEEEQSEELKEKKQKKKKKGKEMEAAKKKKKKKQGSDDSALEESDDGDEEGRELDYISDSSESDSDLEGKVNKEMKGVAEENGLRKLLASDDEEEEEEEKQEEKKSENEDNPAPDESATPNANKKKKKKKKIKKEEKIVEKNEGESSSDFSPDSSDSESEAKVKQGQSQLQQQLNSVSSNGVPGSPAGSSEQKRTASPGSLSSEPLSKKPRIDLPNPALSGSNESGITEEAVRRYLMRKPMTTTELLQKFKSRKTGLSSDQLVNIMTQILKRINPVKQTIKNKMYLFIKA